VREDKVRHLDADVMSKMLRGKLGCESRENVATGKVLPKSVERKSRLVARV
jgi:hypothetical protein